MRLIDADKLIYQSHAQHLEPYINKKDIDDAPTVEMAEDCISRQALIEKATSWDKHFADSERYVSLTDIQNAPSVIPQTKKGKWIEVEVRNCHATLKCSECNRVIEPTYTFGEYSYEDIKEFYPYCHCGARMDADMREVQDGK